MSLVRAMCAGRTSTVVLVAVVAACTSPPLKRPLAAERAVALPTALPAPWCVLAPQVPQ